MHMMSPTGILIIALVVLVLFGKGRVSNLIGEVGRGIGAFRKGIQESKTDIAKEAEVPVSDISTSNKNITRAETRDQA